MGRRRRFRLWMVAAVALTTAGFTTPVRAQDPDDMKRGVARISLIEGEASVQRGDSGEWVAATVNAPVMTGDRLSTGPNSRAEVQFDGANVLRMGGDAEVSFTQLETGRYQMALARGAATFRVLRSSNEDIELDTPSVSVRPSRQGSYRITVNDAGESEITARSGEVEVFTPRGSQWVNSGQTMIARGTASDPEFQMAGAAPYDDWDRWNDSRDRALTQSAGYQHVGPGIYGVEDLDPYGSWVDVPGYGYSWRPVVAPGWAPYRAGRWVWVDWYGWTWVSYEPWGWAPYHWGRWFYEPAYGWCWYPGVIGVRHYWSPALVAFFGLGGGGIGIGFGNVGWVPLAPYEVFHPWWGRGYYGGRGYIDRSVNITNVNIYNTYRNAHFNNGYTVVRGEDFRGGRFNNPVRVSTDQLRSASLVRGAMPINPDRANFRYSDRQTAFVPRAAANTRFFQYRQPNPVARDSGAPQQRGLERYQTGGQQGINRGAPSSGWGRFGEPARQNAVPQAQGITPRNEAGGWRRFGEPLDRQAPQAVQPGPGWGSRQPYSQPQAPDQSRFREPSQPFRGAPRPQYSEPNRPESLRITPPVLRERPNGGAYNGGGFNGPRGGGGFGAQRPEMRAPSGGGFGGPRGGGGEVRGLSGGGGGARIGGGGGGRGGEGGGRGGRGR